MAIFEVWDRVKVPFPYTDRPVRQRRPALVVVAAEIEATHGLLWPVMITGAENRGSRTM
jgi:mRNA interferase MazF